ncbi:MAG: phosphoenolpyruvate carboxylase, partial [Bacteroidota bacterium]
MARTHLPTSELYNERKPEPFHERLSEEFKQASQAILDITEQDEILDNRKVIQDSIHFRNHYTYPLNLIQVELLKRWDQASSDEERDAMRNALYLSINSVAAAMQSTG